MLTRQNVPTLDRTQFAAADGLRRGAYILAEAANGAAELILIASGSEVALDRGGATAVAGAKYSGPHRLDAELGTV